MCRHSRRRTDRTARSVRRTSRARTRYPARRWTHKPLLPHLCPRRQSPSSVQARLSRNSVPHAYRRTSRAAAPRRRVASIRCAVMSPPHVTTERRGRGIALAGRTAISPVGARPTYRPPRLRRRAGAECRLSDFVCVASGCDKASCHSECAAQGLGCNTATCRCSGAPGGQGDPCAEAADCSDGYVCGNGACAETAVTSTGETCDGFMCLMTGCIGALTGRACDATACLLAYQLGAPAWCE